jgi:hypothetical protein
MDFEALAEDHLKFLPRVTVKDVLAILEQFLDLRVGFGDELND